MIIQPKLGTLLSDQVIKTGNDDPRAVEKFCNLGDFLSQNVCLDEEVTACIGETSAAFGSLRNRVWFDHGIRLCTKIAVNQAASYYKPF